MMRCDRATVGKLLDWSVPPAVFHVRVHPRALNSGKRLIYNAFSAIAADCLRIRLGISKKGVDRFPNCHV